MNDAASDAKRDRKAKAAAGIPFMALRAGQCKFPIGSTNEPAPMLFCGAPANIGEPYCPDCERRAYVRSSRAKSAAIEPSRMPS